MRFSLKETFEHFLISSQTYCVTSYPLYKTRKCDQWSWSSWCQCSELLGLKWPSIHEETWER